MTGADDWPPVPASVHQAVRADSGFAYGVVGADIHVFGDGTPLYLLFEHHRSTRRDTGWLRAQPSRMLDARAEIVDFTGRDSELEELIAWRDSGPRFAVRWLHGEAGQGKTRLAGELAADAARARWAAADAVHRTDSHPPALGSQDLRLDGRSGVLLLVDYADRWPVSDLSWLFQNRLLHQLAPARVLLIARSVSGWPAIQGKLQQLRVDVDASDQKLPPLPGTGGQRDHMFTTARDGFARHYPQGVRVGEITPPGTLSHEDFGLTLAVQMAALVAVDARAFGRTAPSDMIGLTTYLLNREHENWQQLSENAAAGLDFRTSATVLARTVFTAVLAGPTDRQTARGVLTDVMPAEPADRVLTDHMVCYPPTDPAGANVLEPLLPDRLAEDFLALLLPGSPVTGYPVDEWAATGPPALLRRRENGMAPAWTARAVTFLAAAADRWPHVGQRHLYPILRTDPRLMEAAGSAALTTLSSIGQASRSELPTDPDTDLLSVLQDVDAALQYRYPRADLDIGLAALTGRLTGHRLAATTDPEDRAWLLYELGCRYTNAGLLHQALAPLEEAVAIGARLAQADPFEHLHRQAGYLSALARNLRGLGRLTDAVAAEKQAVASYLVLIEMDQPISAQDVAGAFSNLGQWLIDVGQPGEALWFTGHAEGIFRDIVPPDRPERLPGLVSALTGHGQALAALGRLREALPVTEESVTIHRQLAEADPAAELPGLARALTTLGARLFELKQYAQALPVTDEAVVLLRRLAEINPAVYRPELATALGNLAGMFHTAGRRPEALSAAEETAMIFRELAEASPAAHLPELARALTNLEVMMSGSRCSAEAIPLAREAVEILRGLSVSNPVYLPGLALSLMNLHDRLSGAGRAQEALSAAEDGVAIYRGLAEANPGGHLPGLAGALNNLGLSLVAGHRLDEALAITEEASGIYRRLADSDPVLFLPGLAGTLTNTGLWLEGLSRQHEALPFLREAVAIRRRLDGEEHPADSRDFAMALVNLGKALIQLDQPAEALPVIEQAAALWRRLVTSDPAAHLPDLADTLHGLGGCLYSLQRPAEALPVTREAARIYQQLAETGPPSHLDGLAGAYSDLGVEFLAVGRPADAVAAAEEAVALRRRMAETDPAGQRPALGRALRTLALIRASVGLPEARAAIEEAVDLFTRLSASAPTQFTHDLSDARVTLEEVLQTLASPDGVRP